MSGSYIASSFPIQWTEQAILSTGMEFLKKKKEEVQFYTSIWGPEQTVNAKGKMLIKLCEDDVTSIHNLALEILKVESRKNSSANKTVYLSKVILESTKILEDIRQLSSQESNIERSSSCQKIFNQLFWGIGLAGSGIGAMHFTFKAIKATRINCTPFLGAFNDCRKLAAIRSRIPRPTPGIISTIFSRFESFFTSSPYIEECPRQLEVLNACNYSARYTGSVVAATACLGLGIYAYRKHKSNQKVTG